MTVLSVKLDEELEAKLSARAAALGLTKSEVIRQAIVEMEDVEPKSMEEIFAPLLARAQKLKPQDKLKESPVIALRRKRLLHARVR